MLRLSLLVLVLLKAEAKCPFSGASASDGPCPSETRQLRKQPQTADQTGGFIGDTFLNCTCKSDCGATVDDGFNCAWCRTSDGCGHTSLAGNYDFCTFPADDEFTKKSFEAKNAYFTEKIYADTKNADSYPSPVKILAESIQISFDNERDEMPAGRVKDIHGIGVICPFDLDIAAGSAYTGLFGPGTQKGFVRMGSAVDPVENKGITPGLGIKFARTGVNSGSYVALHSLATGQSWDFFAYNVSNHIPPAPKKGTVAIIAKKFSQASQCASQVGLSDMATYSQDGTKAPVVKTPFKLFLVPGVTTPATPKTLKQINSELMAFPVGTTLYTVWACGAPLGDEMTPTDGGLSKACGDPFKLGDMVTTKSCTTSAYGDNSFFIRHQRIEEDWAQNPAILTQYDASKACGWDGAVSPTGTPKTCKQKHGYPT